VPSLRRCSSESTSKAHQNLRRHQRLTADARLAAITIGKQAKLHFSPSRGRNWRGTQVVAANGSGYDADMSPLAPGYGVLLLVTGIAMLAVGSSWLVDGASRLALRLGVTPMVVGLTVVGFGTSMPEFTVSLLASLHGKGGLSLGNAVGSNIMNLLLVLGLAAVVAPLRIGKGRSTLRRDLAFGIIPALILVAAAWNGRLGRGPSLLLIAVFVVFLILCIRGAQGDREKASVETLSAGRHLALTAVGIAVLVGGADLMVRGGVSLAHALGVSDAVIGLTLVAFGTSLPELATSVTATLKGHSDLSIGNVLGSNVFNLGLIIGTAFAIRPSPVPTFVVRQDVPILVVLSLVVGFGVLRSGRITRRGGIAMLAMLAGYLAFLVIRGG